MFTAPVLCLVALCGCGQGGKDLAPVSGTVTLDGEPLADGVIIFQPIADDSNPNPGAGSTARTDSEGKFSLETINRKPGAIVGTHKVKVYSYSPETPVTSDTDDGRVQERVPKKYNYTTILTFDVLPEGTDEANFNLTQ
jgi:hypothetical protein